MTLKNIVGIIILTTLIVLSGCQASSEKKLTLKDFNIGSKGLVISLLKNSPPDQVWTDTNFKISLELKNEGLKKVENGIIAVSTCESVSFGEEGSQVAIKDDISLNPRSRFNPEGGITYVDFEVKPESEDEDCLFQIESCYGYETYADPDICVDADIYNLKTDKVCQVKDVMKLKKQAGPVVVGSIEESILVLDKSLKVRFKIFVKNVGSGEVIKLSEFNKICGETDFEPDILNQVGISAKLSNQDVSCSPEWLTLSENDKANYFICTANEVEKPIDAYTAPLSITLNYGYVDTIYKVVEVKNFE